MVDRGIPTTPYSIGGRSSGRASAVDFFQPSGAGGFAADFKGMSRFDMVRMVNDLNVHPLRGRIIAALQQTQDRLDTLYAESTTVTDALVEQELAAEGFTHLASREGVANNKKIIDALIKKHRQNLGAFITTAHIYSGSDPLVLSFSQRSHIGMTAMGYSVRLYPQRAKEQLDRYATSYAAAKDAIILRRVIDQLVGRSAALGNQLVAADAAAKAIADKVAQDAVEKVAAEAQAFNAVNTFRVLGVTGSAQLVTAAGSIAVTQGSTLSFDAAIQAGIQALKSIGSVALDRATGIGIGLLVYSPTLGNSDLYPATSVTLPVKNLAPDLPMNLLEVAAAGGTVDVPYRIYGDSTKYSVVATQASDGVSPKVPVRALTFDSIHNAYTLTTADTPPLTWGVPIVILGNSSTQTLVRPVNFAVYTGVTLTPIQGQITALPATDQLDISDCIYCFPAGSELPPLYAVFSSPYGGAITKGAHSGRMYNPDKAGGPIQHLDWTTASVSQAGIDLVKLHTGRFEPSDGNRLMIDRLEKILRGEIPITDTDKRFYTHEIRELERYRALDIADRTRPDDEGVTWNHAHTATLEDYRLKDSFDLLYTSEAIAAEDLQMYGE